VVNAISQVGMGVLMSQEYNLDDEVGVRIDDLLDLYELRL
jgi:hypothetical protein